MAKKKATKKGMSGSAKVGIGVGVTAAMLAAAGGYFLYGSKHAAQNRKKVKSWMLKAKAEVLDGIEDAKDLSKEDYEKLVDKAAKAYSKLRSTSNKEIQAFSREMKAHWKELEKRGVRNAAKKTAKRTAKKAGKKTAKKAARKTAKKSTRRRK